MSKPTVGVAAVAGRGFRDQSSVVDQVYCHAHGTSREGLVVSGAGPAWLVVCR